MPKKDTRKRIINPKTGRKVLATGTVGKKIKKTKSTTKKPRKSTTKAKKPTKARKSTTKAKKAKKPTKARKSTTKAKKTAKKTKTTQKTRKTIKKPTRKMQESRGMANFINRIEGRKVMKVTKKGDIRLSAGQAYRDGARLGSRHCYGGKCKTLKLDKNKRAYWG